MLILHSSIYLIFIGKNKDLSRSISHNHKFIFVKLGIVRLIDWWVFNLWIYKSLSEFVSLFMSCCQKPLAATKAKDGKIGGGRDQWQRDHKFRRATASLSFRLHSVNVEPRFSICPSIRVFGKLHVCFTWAMLVNLNRDLTDVSIWLFKQSSRCKWAKIKVKRNFLTAT